MKRITIVAAAGALTCLAAMPAAASQAATLKPAASAAGTFGATSHSPRLAASANGVAGFKPVAPNPAIVNPQIPRALTKDKSPDGPNPAAKATGFGATKVAAGTASKGSGSVTNAFDGLNDLTNDQLVGAVTPPDQGLCVGPDHTLKGAPDAVWEVVNEIGQETTKGGTVLTGPLNLQTLFQDANAFSDPRCLFDPSTQSFYFTVISFPAAGPNALDENTVNDVLVVNSHGAATYQFDSSMSGQCLGDQPKVGFDNNALIISTDEYCGPNQIEIGAQVQVISKSQLVNEAATVNFSVSAPLSLAGDPIVGLDPAINTGTPTGYLVNSVPFLPDGSNNPVGNTLGLWTVGNTASVTSGKGTPTLTSKVLPSEPYAFPVPAPSTGDGSVTQFMGTPITSEAALNPDDSRLSGPVNVTPGPAGSVNLWTALDAAVVPSSGTAVRDGAAWFEINTTAGGKLVNQGFVAASGSASLLYPAMQATSGGKAAMVFTITSPTLNPSAAFTTIGKPAITIVGEGTGPHTSFADAPPFNSPRWGDYSQVASDPQTGDLFMATEYIPPATEADGFDNWGTFVFSVKE